jgi:undecaprenyl diphosphate synthase
MRGSKTTWKWVIKIEEMEQNDLRNQLDMNRIPRHIAIIMDGNGRWAEARGKERTCGHQAGVETVRRITAECARLGVKYLTLYTFSMENWNRPASEIQALMGLVLSALKDDIFMKYNVRFRVIGEMNRLPVEVQNKLWETMEATASNGGMTMVVALSYSSRWEITKAVKDIVWELQKKSFGKYSDKELDQLVTEDTISKNLETYFMPDPDLLIRTGGELRVSNYLLWQIAYTELYFCDTYWPDFREQNLYKAILSYQKRQRRFGKTEAQIEKTENEDHQTVKDEGIVESPKDESGKVSADEEGFEEVK